MAVSSPICAFDTPAPDFTLTEPLSARSLSLAGLRGPKGTLVMFLCNHCPYVQAVLPRIIRDARDLAAEGIGIVAISSNDPTVYPEDGPDQMAALVRNQGLPFPYLFDETQAVARAYDAACTPDFFGYNAAGGLQYRGRLDASGRQPGPPDARRELFEAMRQIARTGQGPRDQIAAMGCSIKWREPAGS